MVSLAKAFCLLPFSAAVGRAVLNRFAISLVVLVGAACTVPEPPEVSNAVRVVDHCDPNGSYLSKATFRWFPSTLSFNDWVEACGRILGAMRESPLWCGSHPDTYRILWLHSFSSWPATRSRYPPTMVRVSRRDSVWIATAVQLASSANLVEITRLERRLSDTDSSEMLAAVREFGLWTRKDFARTEAFDGEGWVIEGRRGAGYYPIIRANAESEAVEQLARVFWRLGGLEPDLLRPR
jgi:hypothetical protein